MELTWGEWVEMGEQMKKADRLLLGELGKLKPRSKTKAEAKRLRGALRSLGVVRCVLDDLAVKVFPDKPDAIHIFYG